MPTLVELKNMCKRKGIKGYSKLNKKELEKLVKKLPKKKLPKKKAPKKKLPEKKAPKFGGGLQSILMEQKMIQQVLEKTYAINNSTDIGIQLLPNPNNPNPSFKVWEGIAKVTQFPFKQEFITNFHSVIKPGLTPMDCFINACQLVGILDNLNANILRISCAGKSGFSLDAMEKIFTLKSASLTPGIIKYFNFTDLNVLGGVNLFANVLNNNLKKNHAAFCGWRQNSGAHVFIIAKDNTGKIYYLDPQQSSEACILTNNQVCQKLLENGKTNDRRYYILFNTKDSVPTNIIEDLGFDLAPGRSIYMEGTVFH
jgi:hypothetical protein